MSLSSLIVQREVATMRQVEEALSRQVLYGGDLVTNLLEVAQLPEDVLVPLLAESLGMPHAPLGELPAPDERSRALVPAELADRRAVMPFRVDANKLVLAVAEPLPGDVLDELSFALGIPIEQRIAPMVRIRQAIATWYGVPLERRMQRLVGRLGGEAIDPGSLPPLLRTAPTVPEVPRPVSVPPLGKLPDLQPESLPTPTEQMPPVEQAPPASDDAFRTRPTPAFGKKHMRTTNAGFPAVKQPEPQVPPSPPAEPPPAEPSAAEPPPADAAAVAPAPAEGLADEAAKAPPVADVPEPAERDAAPTSLVQRGRAGFVARPGRRRRGPLALTQAKGELDAADERDTLLDLYFDFSCQFFDYSALFVVHGDIAEGRDAFGSGASRETVAAIGVPLDLPGMLATVRAQCAPIVVRPASTGLDHVLMGDLERKTRTPILVVPVVVRQRAVAILVGDGGNAGVDGATQGEVTAFATLVGQGFERIIVKRKLGGFAGAGGQQGAAKVDPLRVGSKPSVRGSSRPPPVNRAVAADVLERALLGTRPGAARPAPADSARPPALASSTRPVTPAPAPKSPTSGAAAGRLSSPLAETLPPPPSTLDYPGRPPPETINYAGAPPAPGANVGNVGGAGSVGSVAEEGKPSLPISSGEAMRRRVDEPQPELFSQVSALPPPPQVLLVRRPSLPPIPREEPESEIAPTLRDDPQTTRLGRHPLGPRPSGPVMSPPIPSRSPRASTAVPQDTRASRGLGGSPGVLGGSGPPPLALEPTPSMTSTVTATASRPVGIFGEAPQTPTPILEASIEEADDVLLDDLVEDAPSPDPGDADADGAYGIVPIQVVVPAHTPPVSVRGPAPPLPSVIVDVQREFSTLVDRFIADPRDEHVEAELLRQGQHAMPAIMARFPGPLTVDKGAMDELSPPRVSECGPILRLIAGQRRVALPFVLAQVDERDPGRRFWSTFLLSELAYPEAIPAIVSRLFDEDDGTRRVARLAARAVAEVAPEPLVELLDRIVADPQASRERRVATLDTLGDMRDPIVVPALIGALGDESEDISQAARRALTTVTRQDFGAESRKWLGWWGTNSARHRIEWLIDALTHDLPAIRRVAGQELKAMTKEYFGYYDDLPKKERERAQQRYREWWRTEGRARFRRRT